MSRMVLILFAVLLAASAANPLSADEANSRNVLVISIDGLPASVYSDPAAAMPTLRALAAEGAVATEGMRVSTPSVTWPNHTSMVTGTHPEKHSVLFNGLLVRGEPGEPVRVDPRRDKEELVAVPTIYDIAHEAGLSTAEVNWPCTRYASTIDHGFPDTPEVFQHVTPTLRAELIEEGIIAEDDERWDWSTTSAASRDETYTRVAEHVIRQHQPRLMLFHLLNLDAIHHNYGTQTRASYTAIAYADACVRRVLDALDEAGTRDRTSIFIVSDHGFKTAERVVHPNVMLRKAGLLKVEDQKIARARAQAITVGGGALIYLLDPDTREQDREAVRELFRDAEGIGTVLEPDQYSEHHLPDPETNDRMADFVIEAATGYGLNARPDGEEAVVATDRHGHHGYLARQDEMNSIFIASGHGIARGTELGEVEITDIAPTIAALLDLKIPSADGKVLEQVLSPTPSP